MGGVPEHFNFPWHLGMEEGKFEKEGLQLSWTDFPDGTGAMCKALRSGDLDGAVILSEGIVKDISAGSPVKIVQKFIATPLIWGIHVATDSAYQQLGDLQGKTAAISREGSGSQLMAYVNAKRLDWNPEELQFKIVGDVVGAIGALESGEADYFMWEHFTTKPLVDNGTFRRIADCPTPWPCFVIALREEFLLDNPDAVSQMLKVLNEISSEIREIPAVDNELAKRYGQRSKDIRNWLKLTEWSQSQLTEEELEAIQDQLLELRLIPERLENDALLYSLNHQ